MGGKLNEERPDNFKLTADHLDVLFAPLESQIFLPWRSREGLPIAPACQTTLRPAVVW